MIKCNIFYWNLLLIIINIVYIKIKKKLIYLINLLFKNVILKNIYTYIYKIFYFWIAIIKITLLKFSFNLYQK